MNTIDIKNLKISSKLKEDDRVVVCKLENNEVSKIFKREYLKKPKLRQRLKSMIEYSKEIEEIKEIVRPKNIIIEDGEIIGYTMDYIKGENFQTSVLVKKYEEDSSIEKLTEEYLKLEKVVKKANKKKIVMPDILNKSNILIQNKKIYLIDYDGMQIEKNIPMTISSGLGDQSQYNIRKYSKNYFSYTENLDKKSLLLLYLEIVFNIDSYKLLNDVKDKNKTIEKIKELINIEDEDLLLEAIKKVLDYKEDNIYLEEADKELKRKYNLENVGAKINGYQRRLVRKR